MNQECRGFCRVCNCEHSLPVSTARKACHELMVVFEKERRIDLLTSARLADSRFSTDYLYGPARGKMFGVMVARSRDGHQYILRAFSGQYNGVWEVPGWVGPVFNLAEFKKVHDHREREIKALGRQIREVGSHSPRYEFLKSRRKQKSQQLMQLIHALYRFKNFSSQEAGLTDIYLRGKGIPTGTGDCCAPKLLHYAARHNLLPMSIAEFYWGRENSSGSCQHGDFYPSCESKCYPILGFMLCGLQSACND